MSLYIFSPTGGGRSVGIVPSRTKATGFSLVLVLHFLKIFINWQPAESYRLHEIKYLDSPNNMINNKNTPQKSNFSWLTI
jgi:hypothetical protein